jgi:hypothetical protein
MLETAWLTGARSSLLLYLLHMPLRCMQTVAPSSGAVSLTVVQHPEVKMLEFEMSFASFGVSLDVDVLPDAG